MKKTILRLSILILAGFAIVAAAAMTDDPAQALTDKVTVPLSKPGQPARIEVDMFFGSIKVTGYEGKDVMIEAKPREKSLTEGESVGNYFGRVLRIPSPATPPTAPVPPVPATARTTEPVVIGPSVADRAPRIWNLYGDKSENDEKVKQAKSAGMKQIPLESSGLTVEEQNNVVQVELQSFRRAYDIEIKVPVNSSLKLSGGNLNLISVENVSGEIETEAGSGKIKLLNVSGPVTANSNMGDIEVVLNRLMPDKPMSFATFNGDIDVTLPADAKVNLRIKSNQGDLFSDFDVNLRSAPAEPEKLSTRDNVRFKVTLDRSAVGSINGGGAELKFQNLNGNIYIRKKK